MAHHFRGYLSTLQPAGMVFADVFSVFQIGSVPTSWIWQGSRVSWRCSFPLRSAKKRPQRKMMVSSRDCGVLSPKRPFLHRNSSSSTIIISALRTRIPTPKPWTDNKKRLIGTYTGTWRVWKGREGRRSVINWLQWYNKNSNVYKNNEKHLKVRNPRHCCLYQWRFNSCKASEECRIYD